MSKLHAVISYDKHEKSFMVQDLGSVNGTFLNKDQRLSEVSEVTSLYRMVDGFVVDAIFCTLVCYLLCSVLYTSVECVHH